MVVILNLKIDDEDMERITNLDYMLKCYSSGFVQYRFLYTYCVKVIFTYPNVSNLSFQIKFLIPI